MSDQVRPKDQSGIYLMAGYKNVMKYSQTRKLVEIMLGEFKVQPYYQVFESVITEIIEAASLDNLDKASIRDIITKWNNKVN